VVYPGALAGTYVPEGEGKFFFAILDAFGELERSMNHHQRDPLHGRHRLIFRVDEGYALLDSGMAPPTGAAEG